MGGDFIDPARSLVWRIETSLATLFRLSQSLTGGRRSHFGPRRGTEARRNLFAPSIHFGFALPSSHPERDSADDPSDHSVTNEPVCHEPDCLPPLSDASRANPAESTAATDDRSGPGQFVHDSRVQDEGSIHLVDTNSADEPFADSDAKIDRCQEILQYQFQNRDLLKAALTHASGAANRLASNERLEFLGDAILGMTVCQWLFEEYPDYSEGDLTKIKSAVVSRRTCGRTASHLGLDECLIVGRGVTRNRSYPRSLVSDVFESVVAALYLDGGADLVRDRLKQWLAEEVRLAVETQGSGNHKSVLQQYAQRELTATPVYKLVRESGPDHRKTFLIGAVIDSKAFPPAWGNNKKDAEQRAAANALAELHQQPLPHESDEPAAAKKTAGSTAGSTAGT